MAREFLSDLKMAGGGRIRGLLTPSNSDEPMRLGDMGSYATELEVTLEILAALGSLSSVYQPLDSDLTSIAALTTTSYGRGVLETASASGLRTYAGLGTAAVLAAGSANGVATLDSGGKIPTSQIPDSVLGQVEYQGSWNATTNLPTLSTTPASTTKGHYYVTSTGGTFDSIVYAVGDWVVSNGTTWQKIDNTDAVTTVAGRIGAITLAQADISGLTTSSSPTFAGLENTPIGATTPSTGVFTSGLVTNNGQTLATFPSAATRFGVSYDGQAITAILSYGSNPGLTQGSAGGTRASPTATAATNILALFAGLGYDVTNGWGAGSGTSSARIVMEALDNFTNTAQGSQIGFDVTPTGSSVASRLRAALLTSTGFNATAIGTTTPSTGRFTTLKATSLPTSASGLSSGDIWNDGGTLKLV